MKNLGPYKKFIIAAAIIQSVVVIVAGYLLFKSKTKEDTQHKKEVSSVVVPGKTISPRSLVI